MHCSIVSKSSSADQAPPVTQPALQKDKLHSQEVIPKIHLCNSSFLKLYSTTYNTSLYLGDTNKKHQAPPTPFNPFLPLLPRHGCQSFREPCDLCDLLTILWGHSLVGGIFLKLTPCVTDSPENSAALLGRRSLQYPWIATFCVNRVSCPSLTGP